MKIPFVDLKKQYASIKQEVDTAIKRVLDNASFVGGPELEGFEHEFAGFCGARFGIGLSSGTSALELSLRAHGVGAGAEVITVPNTFTATAEAIVNVGAKPVFVDVESETYNMDPERLRGAFSDVTKAVIPVHLFGQPADLDPINDFAEDKALVVIEDACQAHCAEYKKRKIGGTSTSCFSFYPGKNLGAYGDGGAVTTNDEVVTGKIMMLRDHGRTQKYVHELVGYNERLDSLQAAILSVKLKHLPLWTSARRRHARQYSTRLSELDVVTPFEAEYARHVYHIYAIQTRDRDGLHKHLKDNGIDSGIHYPLPLHMQPAYKDLNYRKGDFPVAEKLAENMLSLPMFPELTSRQVNHVCEKIEEFI